MRSSGERGWPSGRQRRSCRKGRSRPQVDQGPVQPCGGKGWSRRRRGNRRAARMLAPSGGAGRALVRCVIRVIERCLAKGSAARIEHDMCQAFARAQLDDRCSVLGRQGARRLQARSAEGQHVERYQPIRDAHGPAALGASAPHARDPALCHGRTCGVRRRWMSSPRVAQRQSGGLKVQPERA